VMLTEDDVLDCASFADAIGVNGWPVERHVSGDVEFVFQKKPAGVNQLPYRMLLPLKIDNLLVAGRCISGDRIAHSAFRNMSCCMVTGQGAGTAAAVSIEDGVTTAAVDIAKVQKRLEAQNVRVF